MTDTTRLSSFMPMREDDDANRGSLRSSYPACKNAPETSQTGAIRTEILCRFTIPQPRPAVTRQHVNRLQITRSPAHLAALHRTTLSCTRNRPSISRIWLIVLPAPLRVAVTTTLRP